MQTMHACHRLLNYAATHPDAAIRYNACDMILHVDSDAAYLVLPKARSRVAGYFYLSNASGPGLSDPPLNGALTVECSALRNVVSSAAEAETGGIFKNSQKAVALRQDLIAIGHPQPPTPIKTDNKTSRDIITSLCKPKKSKSWDMRYHWVEDRVNSKELNLHWKPGTQNWADYFTKHHAPIYHKIMRYKYLQRLNLIVALGNTV